MKPIYLDYMSTTPVDPQVIIKMNEYLGMQGEFANPASRSHAYGWAAEAAVESARQRLAASIYADPLEIIWTSGATEAINLALQGVARFYQRKGRHIITFQTEHKAVLDTCAYLETQGFEVSYLPPQADGLIALETIEAAIRPETILLSMLHVNNEMGTIQDIASIAKLCRDRGILSHIDGAQSIGKVAINLRECPVDLMSFSAHKAYGPKGVGALFVRRHPRVRLYPLLYGGGQERGMRPGTLPVHQIVGMAEAFQLATDALVSERKRITGLRDRLWSGIQCLEEIYLNGSLSHRVANNLNVSVAGVDGEALLISLKDLAVSSGSACTSATIEPSHVLRAIGRSDMLAHSAIRFAIGRFTTEADIDYAIKQFNEAVTGLRRLSPVWPSKVI